MNRLMIAGLAAMLVLAACGEKKGEPQQQAMPGMGNMPGMAGMTMQADSLMITAVKIPRRATSTAPPPTIARTRTERHSRTACYSRASPTGSSSGTVPRWSAVVKETSASRRTAATACQIFLVPTRHAEINPAVHLGAVEVPPTTHGLGGEE